MVKFCIESEEIRMSGEIGITAKFQIITKAKLDSISVAGNCECDGPEEKDEIHDFVFVVDGSDSFNNKVKMNSDNVTDAFPEVQKWTVNMIDSISQDKIGPNSTVSCVQFSGISQLEKDYEPGNWGRAGVTGLEHYRIEVPATQLLPRNMSTIRNQIMSVDPLDGNGQLFLCLQDLTLDSFRELAFRALNNPSADRKLILILLSDEEWDITELKNAFGNGKTSRDSVISKVHEVYDQVHFVCVRNNHTGDLDAQFMKERICNGRGQNYHKVYTEDFENQMNLAGSRILESLKIRSPSKLF